jgi:DegV family protein with EDD domain
MGSVVITADSTSYLPKELLEANDIRRVSLYVNWQGRQDREMDLPSFDEYYEFLRTAPDLPTTSQPSNGDFLTVWEPLLEEGKDIVSIHLAGGISGTCQSAEQARAVLVERGVDADRVHVIDSTTACAGYAWVLLAAAAKARTGATATEVADWARNAREDAKVWFALDTLEYLKRGGRIGGAAAWFGSTLKIKPILSVEGEITAVERVRTRGRAFQRMVDFLRQRKEEGCDRFAINHVQAPDEALRLAAHGSDIYGRDADFVSEIGPVIGTHTGPGLIGAGAFKSSLLPGG